LAVLFVIVSISPVPKTPVPVSNFQLPSIAEPEPPVKSSLHVVVNPAGAPGTVFGCTTACRAACVAAGTAAFAVAPANPTAAVTIVMATRCRSRIVGLMDMLTPTSVWGLD
jgi:hypothetical protein